MGTGVAAGALLGGVLGRLADVRADPAQSRERRDDERRRLRDGQVHRCPAPSTCWWSAAVLGPSVRPGLRRCSAPDVRTDAGSGLLSVVLGAGLTVGALIVNAGRCRLHAAGTARCSAVAMFVGIPRALRADPVAGAGAAAATAVRRWGRLEPSGGRRPARRRPSCWRRRGAVLAAGAGGPRRGTSPADLTEPSGATRPTQAHPTEGTDDERTVTVSVKGLLVTGVVLLALVTAYLLGEGAGGPPPAQAADPRPGARRPPSATRGTLRMVGRARPPWCPTSSRSRCR